MNAESISIPADRIPPVATDCASGAKVWAGVLLFLAAVLAVAVIGGVGDPDNPTAKAKDSAEKAGTIIGMLIVVAIPAYPGFRFARNASRASRAAELARTDAYTWQLAGKWIVAVDRRNGAPRPDVSFKINQKLRTMLLAVPRAEVTQRG